MQNLIWLLVGRLNEAGGEEAGGQGAGGNELEYPHPHPDDLSLLPVPYLKIWQLLLGN